GLWIYAKDNYAGRILICGHEVAARGVNREAPRRVTECGCVTRSSECYLPFIDPENRDRVVATVRALPASAIRIHNDLSRAVTSREASRQCRDRLQLVECARACVIAKCSDGRKHLVDYIRSAAIRSERDVPRSRTRSQLDE